MSIVYVHHQTACFWGSRAGSVLVLFTVIGQVPGTMLVTQWVFMCFLYIGWLYSTLWRCHLRKHEDQVPDRWHASAWSNFRLPTSEVQLCHFGWSPWTDYPHRCALWSGESCTEEAEGAGETTSQSRYSTLTERPVFLPQHVFLRPFCFRTVEKVNRNGRGTGLIICF